MSRPRCKSYFNIIELSTKEGMVNWESERGRKKERWNGRGWEEGTYFEFCPIIVILLLIPLWQNSSDFGFRSLHGYTRCLHAFRAQIQSTVVLLKGKYKP